MGSKAKKIKQNEVEAVLEPDLQVPKTPKTPKDNFELPADFTVIEKKTEKNSWKIYQGPDGKNYRSMTEVKRHLESCTYNTKNLAKTIEFVATDWNCAESGELTTDKNKFYAADVKDFPKTGVFFVDIKTKPVPAKNASSLSKVLDNSTVEASVNDISQANEITKNSMHDDTVDSKEKKKKKKKKNKNKDSSSFLE